MSRRSRRERRPARRREQIEPRERVLVLCEGKNTEPQYLHGLRRWFKNTLVEVVIPDTRGVPLTLVQEAKKLRDDAALRAKRNRDGFLSYDRVWCVFDVDEHPNLERAINMAQDNGIELAISNPCFELWLLLHFRDSPGMQHRHTMQKMMAKFISGYDKKVEFTKYRAGYQEAVARSLRLVNMASEDGDEHRNPTTGVHVLTELIRGY